MEVWPNIRAIRAKVIDTSLEVLVWIGRPVIQLIAEYAADSVMEELFYSIRTPLDTEISTQKYIYKLQLWNRETKMVAAITKETRGTCKAKLRETIAQETDLADAPPDLAAWLIPLLDLAAKINLTGRARAEPLPDLIRKLAFGLEARILGQIMSGLTDAEADAENQIRVNYWRWVDGKVPFGFEAWGVSTERFEIRYPPTVVGRATHCLVTPRTEIITISAREAGFAVIQGDESQSESHIGRLVISITRKERPRE